MKNVKIGLLSLYLKLYDDFSQRVRPEIEEYHKTIVNALKNEGLDVTETEICRIRPEVEQAVKRFENADVDAIVTLHLAYSPSLESAYALADTSLPVIMLDTTRDFCFDLNAAPGSLMLNHGIHGVQDLGNLLKRLGKDYSVFAGHYEKSDVIKRVADAARAIKAAKSLNGLKVGQIGGSFDGMGDFLACDEAVKRLGITPVICDGEALEAIKATISDNAIKAEYDYDCKENGGADVPFKQYVNPQRTALAVREWIKAEGLDAFTMNFCNANNMAGFDTVPFGEACKEMAFGIGYAGEGDMINAALVGALMKAYYEVNFVEMFCPDWKNGTIYFNHMGESNLALLENKHMMAKPFPYAQSDDPTYILGHMKAGKGCILNLLANAEGWFDIVIVEGEMLQLPEKIENFPDSINGWFKPKAELEPLLEKYTELGGTHHSAFVYDVDAKALSNFAKTLGMKYFII